VITATSIANPDLQIVEKFHYTTYMNEEDCFAEALSFADRMIEEGFVFELQEINEVARI
jgi:hypothetical protein|tara:strand:- start:2373 stop:2549 length:177 start_codon:yes stop_codon:yes gene_type:complete